MSIQLTAASSQELQLPSVPAISNAAPFSMTAKVNALIGTGRQVLYFARRSDSNYDDLFIVEFIASGAVRFTDRLAGGTITDTDSTATFAANTWHGLGVSWDGSAVTVRVNGATALSRTVASFTATFGKATLGAEGGANYSTSRLRDVRMWTAALSNAELDAELASATVVRTSGLYADWDLPNASTLTDASGNGRTLTAIGTPTTGADDPTYSGGSAAALLVGRPRTRYGY